MITRIIALALTDARMAFQDRSTWFVLFLLPILFTAILGMSMPGGDGNAELPVLLVDEDGGELGRAISRGIDESSSLRLWEQGDEPLPEGREPALEQLDTFERVVVVPAGATERWLAEVVVDVELWLADGHGAEQSRVVQQTLQSILASQSSARQSARIATEQAELIRPFAGDDERETYFEEALDRARARQAAAPLTIQRVEAAPESAGSSPAIGTAQSSPGQLVTFAFVTLLTVSSVLVGERNLGTLRRLLTYPISRATILIGKVAGRLLIRLLQMTLLIVVGQWLFGVNWGRSPVALALMLLSFALAAVGIGVFFATIARTAEQAGQYASGAALLMAAVGGAWWPLEIVGEPLRTVAYLLPTGWAMQGFQDIILRGAGVAEVIPSVIALLLFALLFFGLGVWRFEYE